MTQVKQIEDFLAHGADLNVQAADGSTPLMHLASNHQHLRVDNQFLLIRTMLQYSPDLTRLNHMGYSALMLYLIGWNHGRCQSICKLLWTGNSKDLMKTGLRDETLFHLLAEQRIQVCTMCTDFLLNYRTAMDVQNSEGQTPLHVATARSNTEMFDYLLAAGANIDVKDKNGMTPFLIACRDARSSYVTDLIDHGANMYAVTNRGLSCLHLTRNPYLLKPLIAMGVNINVQDLEGMTPLLRACKHISELVPEDSLREVSYEQSTLECIISMLQNGADTRIEDDEGKMALSYAAKYKPHGRYEEYRIRTIITKLESGILFF